MILALILSAPLGRAQQAVGTLIVEVRSGSSPAEQVEIQAVGIQTVTNNRGEASLELPAGPVEVRLQRFGFVSKAVLATVAAGTTTRIRVELESESVLAQEITVTTTRTGKRMEDEPLRVEALDHEEVEEKTLMTPGDIAMMLNETSGLRVQVTSPSLGAANVRVQGLRGRYTQLLADGLPLFGGQSGSIGLLQIPPLDLGQVEVIKGVASALYGSSALGGVINLISRRPRQEERELLVNRTSRGGTDTMFWQAETLKSGFGYTLLGGADCQSANDVNGDGWADLPGYRRGTLRPRLLWDNGKGRSWFVSIGAMTEDREGGTIGTAVTPDGRPYHEKLDTHRFDSGLVGRFLFGKRLVSVRASAMTQQHRHQFANVIEHDRHGTWFGEASIGGTDHQHKVTARISAGTGVFAPTPFTEETEASGLTRLLPLRNLVAERASSASADLGWSTPHIELNGTLFASRIRHDLMLREVTSGTAGTMEISTPRTDKYGRLGTACPFSWWRFHSHGNANFHSLSLTLAEQFGERCP